MDFSGSRVADARRLIRAGFRTGDDTTRKIGYEVLKEQLGEEAAGRIAMLEFVDHIECDVGMENASPLQRENVAAIRRMLG